VCEKGIRNCHLLKGSCYKNAKTQKEEQEEEKVAKQSMRSEKYETVDNCVNCLKWVYRKCEERREKVCGVRCSVSKMYEMLKSKIELLLKM
jgi:hypothetical protein